MRGPTYEEIYHFIKMMDSTHDPDDAVALAAIRAANRFLEKFTLDWEGLLSSGDVEHLDWPIHKDLSRKMVHLLTIEHTLSDSDRADLDRLLFLVRFRRLTGQEVLRIADMHMRATR